jgi:hypothetical protein
VRHTGRIGRRAAAARVAIIRERREGETAIISQSVRYDDGYVLITVVLGTLTSILKGPSRPESKPHDGPPIPSCSYQVIAAVGT